MGYFTGSSDSVASLTTPNTNLTMVSMDQIGAAADGSLNGTLNTTMFSANGASARTYYACISNVGAADFDPAIAHGAMVTNRTIFIQNIVALANNANLAGINIDFESLYVTDRDAYSSFVSDLALQLHAVKAKLILSIPAKTSDDVNNGWTWPYNYAVLGQSADYLQVMTYDEHVPGQTPGPVAGSDWMTASLQFAVSQVPARKVLLGLPAYGYDWKLSDNSGVTVNWKDMPALLLSTHAIPQWDVATNSAYINYTAADGSAHQVWFETPQSIQFKSSFAKTFNLAGVSMWALGLEDANFWSAVSSGIN